MNTDQQLDLVFAALSDPTRRAILARLAEGDATVTGSRRPSIWLSRPSRATCACSRTPAS
ncbi:MAG: hypothetical protein R3B07_19360 [Polyangiaceae bacterium]